MTKGRAGYKFRERACKGCGERFAKRMPPSQRYCSQDCYRRSPHSERRTGEHRNCKWCGEEFYVTRGRIDQGQGIFCSIACHNEHQGRNKIDYTCEVCGAGFRWSPSRAEHQNPRYCSMKCRNNCPEFRQRLIDQNIQLQDVSPTEIERIGYGILNGLGVDYRRQELFNGKFVPDAILDQHRVVVQFDGDYWHDRDGTSTEERILERVALDRSQDAYVRECGWEIVRLWGSDLRERPDWCAEQIRRHTHPPSSAR